MYEVMSTLSRSKDCQKRKNKHHTTEYRTASDDETRKLQCSTELPWTVREKVSSESFPLIFDKWDRPFSRQNKYALQWKQTRRSKMLADSRLWTMFSLRSSLHDLRQVSLEVIPNCWKRYVRDVDSRCEECHVSITREKSRFYPKNTNTLTATKKLFTKSI